MHRTIIVGSPRENGKSAHLAQELFDACIEDCPNDGVSIVSICSVDVGGCIGCDACKMAAGDSIKLPEKDDPLYPARQVVASDSNQHLCVIQDDMLEVRKHIDAADELIVVCPVYFSSAPSQMKALLDRLQPYFWSDIRKVSHKRQACLHIVGEGGDPHGYEPLITLMRSALGAAGFKVLRILDWVGKISADGEIEADADEL